jgi:hypothetical protein
MTVPTRIPVRSAPQPGNAGITARYPLDVAAWVWHPNFAMDRKAVLEFLLDVDCAEDEDFRIDLTADQRFILSIDGTETGRGPDRAELGGWSFHRYAGRLKTGSHRIKVLAWWLPEHQRPCAQVTAQPAFALTGYAGTVDLSTGVAPWRVREIRGWNVRPKSKALAYHVIGCGFDIDGEAEPGPWGEPETVRQGGHDTTGCIRTPWRLEPSPLPEQRRTRFEGGKIRAVQMDASDRIRQETDTSEWSALPRGGAVTVPANTTLQILWDLETYVCGYSNLHLIGGKGSVVEVEWAESLYENHSPQAREPKGNRNDCAGKYWLGFGDRIRHAGGDRPYSFLWWRSGRWIRLQITTKAEPLILRDVRPMTTNYPFEREWSFDCDGDLRSALDICESGLRHCVHETFVDCPYYEQMQYLGDTRTQALAWMLASRDPRPVARALELFDRSRWVNGFHAERCPTDSLQMSATYSLVYPPLLRDFAWWRDEEAIVRRLLPGCRSALEYALADLDEDGLPSNLPGWLFVDWVKEPFWEGGLPPGTKETGSSAPVALHLPVALDAAAQLEDTYGDPFMATRWRQASADVLSSIMEAYYQPQEHCFSDDREGHGWSEHAQALALACEALPDELREPLLNVLENPPAHFAKATVYFSYHVHEALLNAGRTEAVLTRFDFWRKLKAQGFTTTVEAPEPSRSDCHGWGAHPLYHCLSSLAGIRPAEAGFKRVRITPRFGSLTRISATAPHPLGSIRVDISHTGNHLTGYVESPVPGILMWNGTETELVIGKNILPSR